MLQNRLVLFILTALTMIALLALGVSPFLAALLTFVLTMAGYLLSGFMRSRNRLRLLDDACNPVAFLERTGKQRMLTGKHPAIAAYLDIDQAAGLITLGQFAEARTLLLSIDTSRLSRKNDSLLAYTINLILCHYETGDVGQAEA